VFENIFVKIVEQAIKYNLVKGETEINTSSNIIKNLIVMYAQK